MLLLPWFKRVAMENLADGLVADFIDHFEFHELVGQQAQTPARLALGRLFTAQGDHLGFLSGIKLARPRPHQPGLALQGGAPTQVILPACPLHGGHAEIQRFGNPGIAPAPMTGLLVGQQQDSRTALRLGAASSRLHQLFQPEALLRLQRDSMLLEHRPSQQDNGFSQPDT